MRLTARHRVLWLSISLLLSTLASGEAQERPAARLTSYQGLISILQLATGRSISPIQNAMALGVGTSVRTGATGLAALLLDPGGREVKLFGNTVLDLTGTSPDHFVLHRGRMRMQISHRSRAVIDGPTAKAVARHTELEVAVDETDAMTLTVVEGEVEFSNPRGSVVVRTAQQSVARPGQPPTPPVAIDPTSLIPWEATVESLAVTLELPPLPGAGGVPGDANRAQSELRDGRLAEATAAFERLAADHPASAEGPLGLGMRYLATGDTVQALPHLTRAAALDPVSPRAATFLGVAKLRSGDLAGAEEELRRALARDARFYPAHAYLSFTLTLKADTVSARAAARRAVELAPDSGLAREALANALFFSGEPEAASVEVERALRANPLSSTARLTQARIRVVQGRLEEGIQAAEQAAALDRDNPVTQTTLGVMLLARNDPAAAERAFRRALALAPQSSAAQSGLGAVSLQRGAIGRALPQLKAAVQADGASATAQNNLGAVFLAQGKLDAAIGAFREAAVGQPQWGLPHANQAQADLEQNRYAEALAEAQQAVRLGEQSAILHTTLARVYARTQRLDRALAELRLAEALDPEYPPAQFQLSRLFLEQNRDLDALRTVLRATSLHPGAMVENRLFARTEVTLAGGGQDTRRLDGKTDGRAQEGALSYFVSGTRRQTDNDRKQNGDQRQSFEEALAGYERRPSHQWLLFSSRLHQSAGRPGRQLAGVADDPNFRSEFDGWETHLIHRLSTGLRSHLTLKAGRRDADLVDRNPDSLGPTDPKPFSRLDSRSAQTLGEGRWDVTFSSRDRFTAGFAWRRQRDRLDGRLNVVSDAPGSPTTVVPTRVTQKEMDRTFYGEWTHRAGDRLDLKLGGILDLSSSVRRLAQPKLVARYRPSGRSYLVFLAYPRLPTDATELSPVEAWAQPLGFDRLDLNRAGSAMSYELNYERPTSRLSLLSLSLFNRRARGLLLDLEDPRFAPAPRRLGLDRARVRGAQAAYEHTLGPTLSGRLFFRYQDTEDRRTGHEFPYFDRWQGGARLDYLDRAGWRGFLAFRYVGTRAPDRQTPRSDLPAPEERPRLPGYAQVDVRLERQLDLRRSLFVGIDNLFDRRYELFPGYPAVGRNVIGGVEYRF